MLSMYSYAPSTAAEQTIEHIICCVHSAPFHDAIFYQNPEILFSRQNVYVLVFSRIKAIVSSGKEAQFELEVLILCSMRFASF